MVPRHDVRGPEPRAAIPRFFLYGEPPRDADERFLHVETIADRSRLYDWRIRPHAHRDLHQILVLFTGGGEMQAETQRYTFQAPVLLVAPAGVVHGFVFTPETEGYVVTLADTLLQDLGREEVAFKRLFQAPTCTSLAADRLRGSVIRSPARGRAFSRGAAAIWRPHRAPGATLLFVEVGHELLRGHRAGEELAHVRGQLRGDRGGQRLVH